MVAAEQGFLFGQTEAQVVRGMARGMDRLQGPALAFDNIAVADREVGNELMVAAFLHIARRAAAMGPEAVGFSAGGGGDQPRRRRMIEMGVGDDLVADGFAVEGRKNGVHVFGKLGPRVDHRDLAAPDQISAGAVECE